MAEIKCKAVWCDTEKWQEQLVEYCGIVEVQTKSGNIVKPMLFMGQDGDYYCFMERIANLRELISKLGKDDSAWIGKRFLMNVANGKKFCLKHQAEL